MSNEPTPNNQEIDQALKEFEAKSGVQEHPVVKATITPQPLKKEVEGISFDTDTEVDHYKAIKMYEETTTPKMVKAIIKLSGGAVKTQKQAEWILLTFVIIAMGISIFLLLTDIIHFPSPSTTSNDPFSSGVPSK
jgi:hypothetical protein